MNIPRLAAIVALIAACMAVPARAAKDDILAQLDCGPRSKDKPYYHRTAVLQHQTGVVLVEFSVNAKGRTERAIVISATAPEVLQSSALRVAQNFKCKPGNDWAETGGPERRIKLNVVFKFENEEAPKPIDESAGVVVVTAAADGGRRSPRPLN